MKQNIILSCAVLLLIACGNKEKEYDATGTFEATEATVYAEQSGSLMRFEAEEGMELGENQEFGLIDTTQIELKIHSLRASREVFGAQKPDIERQIAATKEQLSKARLEQKRYAELVSDGAAPRKMLDDANSQVLVLQRQLDAQVSSLNTSSRSLDKQMAATDTQIGQLYDQLFKCHIKAPLSGTVLEKYVERGEFVTVGKPLVKIGDIKNMFLRAYVTSEQLANIKIGQKVKVYADYGANQKKEYDGTITWISNRSEFTPKTILTDNERADLVYAVKIAVKNDGYLKIGMYGEVVF